MSLALSTLIYEWRRYMAAIIALAVAGMLVLLIIGLFMGIAAAYDAPIVRSPAEIMVLNPKSTSLFNGGAGLPQRLIGQVYLDPEVTEVTDLEGDGGLWINDPKANGKGEAGSSAKVVRIYVNTFAMDARAGSVTLPKDFGPEIRWALGEPFAVVMDETSLKQLGVRVGDKASLNSHTVVVRAVVHGYASATIPMVFISRQTARLIGVANTGSDVGPLMVHIKDPAQAIRVRDELNAHSEGLYRAWTREELAAANELSLLQDNLIGVMLVGSLVVGLIVGVSITWQTLQGAILANIKEFASLRALGVSMGSLRWIVMELSFWVGVAGLIATAVMTSAMTQLAGMVNLPMDYPLPIIGVVVAMLMVIAILSGVFSLGVLGKSQPADLLR